MSSNNLNDRVPALSPPSGVTPNFANPYSLRPAFVATAILCLLLATSAAIVRLATSFCRPTKRLRVEDCRFLRFLGVHLPEVDRAHADRARYMCSNMGG